LRHLNASLRLRSNTTGTTSVAVAYWRHNTRVLYTGGLVVSIRANLGRFRQKRSMLRSGDWRFWLVCVIDWWDAALCCRC
jgi:hypothetical protein